MTDDSAREPAGDAAADEAAVVDAWMRAWADNAGAWLDLDVFTLPGEYQARFTLHGVARGFRIASLSAPRELAGRLGLGTPVGFREEPLVPRKGARLAARERVAEMNRTHVHWRGDVPVDPDVPCLLRIPAARLEAGFGHLSIEFASETGGGGGAAFRYLPIGLADPRAARKAMMRWNDDRWSRERAFGPVPPHTGEGEYGQPVRTTPFIGGKLPRKSKPAG